MLLYWVSRHECLLFKEYFSPDDFRQLCELMKALTCAVQQQNLSITSAHSHICMQNKFSYSISINLWVPALFMCVLSVAIRKCWQSLIYACYCVCLFVCVVGEGGVEVQWLCRVQFPIVWNLIWLLVWHDTGLLVRVQTNRVRTIEREKMSKRKESVRKREKE